MFLGFLGGFCIANPGLFDFMNVPECYECYECSPPWIVMLSGIYNHHTVGIIQCARSCFATTTSQEDFFIFLCQITSLALLFFFLFRGRYKERCFCIWGQHIFEIFFSYILSHFVARNFCIANFISYLAFLGSFLLLLLYIIIKAHYFSFLSPDIPTPPHPPPPPSGPRQRQRAAHIC